jgi:hypothetical protein
LGGVRASSRRRFLLRFPLRICGRRMAAQCLRCTQRKALRRSVGRIRGAVRRHASHPAKAGGNRERPSPRGRSAACAPPFGVTPSPHQASLSGVAPGGGFWGEGARQGGQRCRAWPFFAPHYNKRRRRSLHGFSVFWRKSLQRTRAGLFRKTQRSRAFEQGCAESARRALRVCQLAPCVWTSLCATARKWRVPSRSGRGIVTSRALHVHAVPYVPARQWRVLSRAGRGIVPLPSQHAPVMLR